MEKKKGFTLIELLITIAVIALVFVIGSIYIYSLIDDSTDTMNKATELLILNAAEEYAVEFSNDSNWKEQIDDNGNKVFCITLESLINYGYFGANQEKVNEYKNKYSIKMTVTNGVYSYEVIDKSNADKICSYFKEEINVTENSNGNFSILEENVSIGDINYNVNKVEENIFEMNIKLGIDFKVNEIVKTIPTYLSFVVDNSGSMKNNDKYKDAKNAAINFSNTIINDIDNSQISLIQYNTKPRLKTDGFIVQPLSESDFLTSTGSTNTSGGLDMATALFYGLHKKENINKENANFFTILLYDGEPNYYSYLSYGGKSITPSNINEENKDIYFDNFNNSFVYSSCSRTKCIEYVIDSSKHLKNIGTKFIVIGYGMDAVDDRLKSIATLDNELCKGSDYKDAFGDNYCYYETNNAGILDLFSNISSKIVENVKSTNAKLAKIILTPSILPNGEKSFSLRKDGVEVENDQIIEEINIENNDESVRLVIDEKYQLVMNEKMFENCPDEKCTIENIKLFNLEIILEYEDKESTNIIIDSVPNITVTSTKIITIN